MKRPLCYVCVAFVVTVFLYLKFGALPGTAYDQPEGSRVTLSGEVYQKEYKNGALILHLRHAEVWEPAKTDQSTDQSSDQYEVLCYLETGQDTPEPKAGSTVLVEGNVSLFDQARNPGGFDAQEYYRIQGIDFRLYRAELLADGSRYRYSVYRETLCQLRYHFEGIFDAVLAPKDASVMKAVLLGNKSGLDAGSKALFQKSGIAHIFAISGLHITLLGMGLYRLLRRACLPHLLCAVTAVGMMTAYGDMVGMSSSAYRAVFMFALQLAARLLRRTYDMLTALALAAVLILLEQPRYLFHTGFLLSFGAILGIGCLSEVMKPVWKPVRSGRTPRVVDKVMLSLCASLGIFLVHFPVMLCAWYEFPVYSFLLNLVIIPAMSFLMAAGLLCLGLGSLPFAAGMGTAKVVGLVCHGLISVFEQLCTLSLRLPFADWVVGRPEDWKVCVFVAVVLYLYAVHHYGVRLSKTTACWKRGIQVMLPYPVKLITVLAAVVFLSDTTVNGVTMTFLDVGQGDCIWVEGAGGEHFLIDGGSSSEKNVGTYTILPYLKYKGVSSLDAVFLTHLDSDHISGVLELLGEDKSGTGESLKISRVCISDAVIEDSAYENLATLCASRAIPVYRLKAGDRMETKGLCFEVLHPKGDYEASSRNAYSLVIKLEVTGHKNQKVTALLTGDVEEDGEQAVADGLHVLKGFEGIDIYKAAHHGSRYSNTEELISLASPELAIISCGEKNSYGHPHAETIERLEQAGSDIRMTKDTGAITINIKNGKYTVDTYIK